MLVPENRVVRLEMPSFAMKNLERYTPEVCSKLRHIAEQRQWRSWRETNLASEEVAREIELTYHLHIAAEATGKRAGMPPMPPFPMPVESKCDLDPAEFVNELLSSGKPTRN